MQMNKITADKQNIELVNRIKLYVMYSLLGRATKKMRGITANINNNNDLLIEMFFDSELTEEEEEEMEVAHTEIVSDLYQEFNGMYLNLTVITSSTSLSGKNANLGWFFLRREYEQ